MAADLEEHEQALAATKKGQFNTELQRLPQEVCKQILDD
jgi:hypothetical protein